MYVYTHTHTHTYLYINVLNKKQNNQNTLTDIIFAMRQRQMRWSCRLLTEDYPKKLLDKVRFFLNYLSSEQWGSTLQYTEDDCRSPNGCFILAVSAGWLFSSLSWIVIWNFSRFCWLPWSQVDVKTPISSNDNQAFYWHTDYILHLV